MSAPLGNREFRNSCSSRARGQPSSSSRGKPILLQRPQGGGNGVSGSNLFFTAVRKVEYSRTSEGTSRGSGMPVPEGRPQYGAPPKSAFGPPTSGYGMPPPAFARLTYDSAPTVQGSPPPQPILQQDQPFFSAPAPYLPQLQTSLQQFFPYSAYSVLHAPPEPLHQQPQFVNPQVPAPMPLALAQQFINGSTPPFSPLSIHPQMQRAQQIPMHLQQRMQAQFQANQRRHQEPKFVVEPLTKFSPTLKLLVYYTPSKKVAALVETDDDKKIEEASKELLSDLMEYDGRSNVSISKCSMPYLEKRSIEYLPTPHTQFTWAPYYCNLCDFHLSDIFAAEGHLPTHMKEEKRLNERRTLPDRLPPLRDTQLAAIEKVLVETAVKECPPDREAKLRSSAESAMESVREICKLSQFNDTQRGIHLALHGSLVSGLLTENSDINISLKMDGENTKYFVDTILTSMEKAAEWSEVRVSESPTGVARIEAVFNDERVTIDWQNDEGVRTSQLLALYNRLHEDVIPLRQIVHQWAERCDLVAEEKLASQHAVPRVLLDVMLIHALQQSRRMPCVHEIRKTSGKDAIDPDLEDIISEPTIQPIRWNLAEVFLEFLHYFSKGDVKQFLIQITCMERTSKMDTKFNKKHLNVIDPIKDRPIASLHKAFQCYFINCFLTTYVHFRIPRARSDDGTGSKSLVDIDVYQTASQSPKKKKCTKGARGEDQKEEGDEEEKETPGSSSDLQSAVGDAIGARSDKNSSSTDAPKDYTADVLIHGKLLEEMQPEDFEIHGECVYSRSEMRSIEEGGCRIGKELWDELFSQNLNTFYLAPDSDGETSVGTPQTTPGLAASGTPASSVTSSKKKRKKKQGKKGKVDGQEDVEEKIDEHSASQPQEKELSIGKCAAVALDATAEMEAGASTSSAPAVNSAAAPPAASPKGKPARRVLKLIKLDSAESSDLSCDASPTPENAEDMIFVPLLQKTKIGDLTRALANSSLVPTDSSGVHDSTSSNILEKKEDHTVAAANNVVAAGPAVAVTDVVEEPKTEEIIEKTSRGLERREKEKEIEDDEELAEKQEKETECGDDDDAIVLPESTASGLQPTFEELYIDLKQYDLSEVTASLDKLGEDDFDYSFDTATLTAGFKCDQHCSACDSPKHLVSVCPQLKVPPVRDISRSHWKAHFSGELDRIICMIFDNEKISKTRRKELKEVMARLNEAIQMKLKDPFRLNAFGSSENGFGSNRSDFDVCFRYGEEFDLAGRDRSTHQMSTILNIENALRYARFHRVMSITTAKVPIVKFAMRVDSGEIEGDISYYNELALHNTQLLKRYCSWTKDEVLSKLGMFIKRWAKQCDIGDASKGSLSSYAYIILVIHFLQRLQPHPLLPVLQEMGEKEVIQVDGWDVYFCDDEPKPNWSQCTLSVGELFLQFLEYFARFDWHNQVVQIRQTNKLTKIERGWRKLMCIEDPFDLDHNLGSGISNRMFAFIMKSFVNSREVFFTLKERGIFMKQYGEGEDQDGANANISDSFIPRYGSALLAKCRASVGGAPRDRQCFKCGRIGHFSDACPSNGSGQRGGGTRGGRGGGGSDRGGRGGGAVGRDDRGGGGGAKRDEPRYRDRDTRKERLAVQRESYRAANEK
ncbi:hypothetical protein PENTCL1PPCAC_13748 [Pristionchus entomophagus]|uniref:CCHC-type domain-containing protein n=1 Tax=Pristionchus entomophagus TaxID=358040 RepID=A0AAV5TEU8_9BILA|nr:hypothetical protein PENTCL1PPCAC_13748 [Pristionchus entomophagus]